MKIMYRVDGSKEIGMGHVITSFPIVRKMVKKTNTKIIYIMRDFKNAVDKVRKEGYRVLSFPRGYNEKQEIEFIAKMVKKEKPSIYITDLLEIKNDYSDILKKERIFIVSIDILGDIKLKPDVLINRTIIKERWKKYNTRNKKTKYFLGSKYLILPEDFEKYAKYRRRINKEVKNILVTMGGSDPKNLTLKSIKALNLIDKNFKVNVMIGPAYEYYNELKKVLKQTDSKFEILKDVNSMAEIMLKADMAISAGGKTLYELAFTQTPSLILCEVDHQVFNANEFSKRGIVSNLGLGENISVKVLAKKILDLMDNFEKRKRMSLAGRNLVDAKGAERCVNVILRKYSRQKKVKMNRNGKKLIDGKGLERVVNIKG